MEQSFQESAATSKFRAELKAFLQNQLGMTGPAIDKVADSTIQEAKKLSTNNNLDDLNDVAKQFFFSDNQQ
jgi:hypothetical protein